MNIQIYHPKDNIDIRVRGNILERFKGAQCFDDGLTSALKGFDGDIFKQFEDYVKTIFENFHFCGCYDNLSTIRLTNIGHIEYN